MARKRPGPLSVWLVEDDRHYREAVISLLDGAPGMACGHVFESAERLLVELERLSENEQPDVLLLDVHLPGQSGLEALPQVSALVPATTVVMLTVAEDREMIFGAFQAGASGYLVKDAPASDILEAVRQAAAGGVLMPAPVATHMLAHFRRTPTAEYALTDRERDVLRLMTEGLSQREIAEQLFVSPHTVNTHVQHLYAKLQVNSGIGAVAKAVREKLV